MDHYKLFINGEFVDAQSGETFESIDPGTGLTIATVAKAGAAEDQLSRIMQFSSVPLQL